MVKWIIGAVIGVFIMISAFLAIDPNVSVNNNGTTNSTVQVEKDKINVMILGAVINPGTYTMSKEDCLGDLISKAGGIISSADESCFEESIPLEGHESFYIPFVPGFSQECSRSDAEKININTASVDEIASINGISNAIAQNIVTYRQTNGEFICLEDLINVSGIGPKTFEKIRDYISIK